MIRIPGNKRRLDLIDKLFDEGLNEEEEKELAALTEAVEKYLDEHLPRHAPLTPEELELVERSLKNAKKNTKSAKE